jgi:GNAT superfamily N-acetyltransferase
MTNQDNLFYETMGPYLSRREICKELGYSVWDDDTKVWFIALVDDQVAGFGAALSSKSIVRFCSDYVLPKYRGLGVYEAIFDERLKEFDSTFITATVTDASLPIYLSNGFKETDTRGKYHIVKREKQNE